MHLSNFSLNLNPLIKFPSSFATQIVKSLSLNISYPATSISNFIENYEDKKLPYLIYSDTDSLFVALGDYLIDKGEFYGGGWFTIAEGTKKMKLKLFRNIVANLATSY